MRRWTLRLLLVMVEVAAAATATTWVREAAATGPGSTTTTTGGASKYALPVALQGTWYSDDVEVGGAGSCRVEYAFNKDNVVVGSFCRASQTGTFTPVLRLTIPVHVTTCDVNAGSGLTTGVLGGRGVLEVFPNPGVSPATIPVPVCAQYLVVSAAWAGEPEPQARFGLWMQTQSSPTSAFSCPSSKPPASSSGASSPIPAQLASLSLDSLLPDFPTRVRYAACTSGSCAAATLPTCSTSPSTSPQFAVGVGMAVGGVGVILLSILVAVSIAWVGSPASSPPSRTRHPEQEPQPPPPPHEQPQQSQ